MNAVGSAKKYALIFVILMGLVSLFADMTYEGARSIAGPFLGTLGASAAWIGLIAGFGELTGYGLRLVFGYISDRTKQYWSITIIGYVINLAAVPLLALADRWEVAAALVIAERLGKAVRTPARDAMLSFATHQTGRGWGFGMHEALDQIGAVLGPLLVALIFFFKGSYKYSFALLAIPAILAISILLCARFLYPSPQKMERAYRSFPQHVPKAFWIYMTAAGLIAVGFADYPLISYHFSRSNVLLPEWIPIFYAVAMGTDGLAALVFGYLYDRIGYTSLIIGALLASLFAPLVFWGGLWAAFSGCVLWGIGMGVQESILRAIVADMIPQQRRATAYGIFNSVFGLCWFIGSALMGFLYGISLTALVVFSLVAQFLSVPLLFAARYQQLSDKK